MLKRVLLKCGNSGRTLSVDSNVLSQGDPDGVGDRRLGRCAPADEDVPELSVGDEVWAPKELDPGGHRRRSEARQGDADIEEVVEAQRRVVPHGRLGDHDVDAVLDHDLVVGPERLAPELGQPDVEVLEVARVEDDPLGVALGVSDP